MAVVIHKGWVTGKCIRFQKNSNCFHSLGIESHYTEKNDFQIYICNYFYKKANFAQYVLSFFWNISGTKSEVLNIDDPDLAKYPLFSKARRYECSLNAGDVLFIPGKISGPH